MPLLLVQFFSWFALFSMWVFTTPAVAKTFFHTVDPNSAAFQEAGDLHPAKMLEMPHASRSGFR